jgi:hypothetical protein
MNDELRYMNEIEDIELNRDWSQPNKLNSGELLKYKKNVESTLERRKPKINYIVNFAERLIENKHPASKDLNVRTVEIKLH